MPQTKSGFKNWQRIIALFLVFIFSAEQITYAGRLDDAYSSIKSTLKSSVSSAKTSYNSWTQSNRANYPNVFNTVKPLIAAVDLARSAVTRTPPAFYNSWTADNRQTLPNAARAYDTNGPFGAAFYAVGLVTNPVFEKATGIKAGSVEAKAKLQDLHKWIPAPVNLAIKASIGKDLDNPYASTKQGWDKITSITPKEAVIGAIEVGFPVIGKGLTSLVEYAGISSTSLGLGATSTYITTKVLLPITKYALESPLLRATAKTALKQGVYWGTFNVAADVGISLITGHQLTKEELTNSFGIGFASGAAFTGGTFVLGKLLIPFAEKGSWAVKIGEQAANGKLTGLSRLQEWPANIVRKAANFGTVEGITALPALSYKGVKVFAGASLVFTPVGALVNYGFDKDVTKFNQAISPQSFATNAIYMGLGSGTLKYDQTTGAFIGQDLNQGFRFDNRGGAFWGPAIGVTALPTSVFTGSTSRIAQALEVNALSPGARGIVDTLKVLSGKASPAEISKTLLYRAANPSYFWNKADSIVATASVGAWLGITENVALKLGVSPQTASNLAFMSLFLKPSGGANQIHSEIAGVKLDALERKGVDVFKLEPGTFSESLTQTMQGMAAQKRADKSYKVAHAEAKKNGLNLRIDPISSGQINVNLGLEKSPFVVVGENPGKLDVLAVTDPSTGKMQFISSPKGQDSLSQHLKVLQDTVIMKGKSPYAVLGVEEGTSWDDVKTAYGKLAKKVHPDLNKGVGDPERFKEITEAKKIIDAVSASPDTKKVYDAALIIKDFLNGNNGNGAGEKVNTPKNTANPKLLSSPSLRGHEVPEAISAPTFTAEPAPKSGGVKNIMDSIVDALGKKLPNPLPMVAAAAPEKPVNLANDQSISQSASTSVSLRGAAKVISVIQPTNFNVPTRAIAIPLGQSSVGNTPPFVPSSPSIQGGGVTLDYLKRQIELAKTGILEAQEFLKSYQEEHLRAGSDLPERQMEALSPSKPVLESSPAIPFSKSDFPAKPAESARMNTLSRDVSLPSRIRDLSKQLKSIEYSSYQEADRAIGQPSYKVTKKSEVYSMTKEVKVRDSDRMGILNVLTGNKPAVLTDGPIVQDVLQEFVNQHPEYGLQRVARDIGGQKLEGLVFYNNKAVESIPEYQRKELGIAGNTAGEIIESAKNSHSIGIFEGYYFEDVKEFIKRAERSNSQSPIAMGSGVKRAGTENTQWVTFGIDAAATQQAQEKLREGEKIVQRALRLSWKERLESVVSKFGIKGTVIPKSQDVLSSSPASEPAPKLYNKNIETIKKYVPLNLFGGVRKLDNNLARAQVINGKVFFNKEWIGRLVDDEIERWANHELQHIRTDDLINQDKLKSGGLYTVEDFKDIQKRIYKRYEQIKDNLAEKDPEHYKSHQEILSLLRGYQVYLEQVKRGLIIKPALNEFIEAFKPEDLKFLDEKYLYSITKEFIPNRLPYFEFKDDTRDVPQSANLPANPASLESITPQPGKVTELNKVNPGSETFQKVFFDSPILGNIVKYTN